MSCSLSHTHTLIYAPFVFPGLPDPSVTRPTGLLPGGTVSRPHKQGTVIVQAFRQKEGQLWCHFQPSLMKSPEWAKSGRPRAHNERGLKIKNRDVQNNLMRSMKQSPEVPQRTPNYSLGDIKKKLRDENILVWSLPK